MDLAAYIEHSALKPDTVSADIESVCSVAREYKFNTICVPPLFVKKAKMLAGDTGIKVATVVGFPYGYSIIEAKVAEIVLAVIDGADEIEMVMNTSAVKNNDWQYLANEINTVLPIPRNKGKKLTVIIETGLLTATELIKACDIYSAAGVDFVKAGTGTMENKSIICDLALIRKHLADPVQIKTAAFVGNYSYACELIKAGTNRLSTDNGHHLIREYLHQH